MEPGSVKLENKRLNIIPAGRQLQRTPPSSPQPGRGTGQTPGQIKHEADPQTEGSAPSRLDEVLGPAVKEERKSVRRSSITSASAMMGDADPDAFIQGMQGYQWTDADLEFVYQARQQKRVQQLQQELSEVLKTLKAETQRLELAVASRDRLEAELSKTLSCELLLQMCRDVLLRSCPPDQLEGLGDKALLSQLQLRDVQHAISEETADVSRLRREVVRAQEIRDREELAMKEMDERQKNINTVKANIEALKTELTELKVQLSEKEVLKAAPQKGRARKVPRLVRAPTTSDALKPTKEKKAPKEKTPKQTSASKISADKSKTEPADRNVQPAESEEAPKGAQATERARKAPRTAKAQTGPANGIGKAPKGKDLTEKAPKERDATEKAPKQRDLTERAPKEKAPKGKASKRNATKERDATEKAPKERDATEEAPKERDTVEEATKERDTTKEAPKERDTTEKAPKERDTVEEATKESDATERGTMKEAPKERDATEKAPKERDSKEKAPKERDSKEKAPKERDSKEKAPKARDPKERAPATEKMPAKEIPPKKKTASKDTSRVKMHTEEQTEQNVQAAEIQRSSKAARAPAKPRKAAKPPSPSESDAGTLRRSKRIATKSQSEAAPQRTGSSRRR